MSGEEERKIEAAARIIYDHGKYDGAWDDLLEDAIARREYRGLALKVLDAAIFED